MFARLSSDQGTLQYDAYMTSLPHLQFLGTAILHASWNEEFLFLFPGGMEASLKPGRTGRVRARFEVPEIMSILTPIGDSYEFSALHCGQL
jgi:hypothetical protein